MDVDGVLNPARPASGYRRHWVFPAGVAHRLLLNPSHGRMLTDLADATGAELVWGSYWQNRANTWIAPRVGLPCLRFVPIPPRVTPRAWMSPGRWKARHAAAWVGDAPFVWFEDNPTVATCLARQPGLGRYLVVRVDPTTGLTHEHIEQARLFLLGVQQGVPADFRGDVRRQPGPQGVGDEDPPES